MHFVVFRRSVGTPIKQVSANREKPDGKGLPVCHITTVHMPFDVRIFHKECASLKKAGWDVHLVACTEKDRLVHGVRIHALPLPPNRAARMLFWPMKALFTALSIRPRPVLFHIHDPELLPAAQILRQLGCRVIYDVHENVADLIRHKRYLPKILRVLFRSAYKLTECFLLMGIATVHVLESISARYRQPKVVVKNFPHNTGFPTATPLQSGQIPRLIYVGEISRCRGAAEMVQAVKILHKKGMDCELRLIGRMENQILADRLQVEISAASLDHKIQILPWMPYSRVVQEISDAHIGLCVLKSDPNYTNSLATKIFEYMRAGLPVIASDFPIWRPYVTGIGSGVQVDPDSPHALAEAIEHLLSDPRKMQDMGRRGRQVVRERFCWEKEEGKLLEFYRQMVKRRSRGSRPG